MFSKKQISILLGHAVTLPANTTGGAEKVFENIFESFENIAGFQFLLICKSSTGQLNIDKISENKTIVRIKGFAWSSSKSINLYNSFIWFFRVKKYLTDSDFVLYNTLFGPFLHWIFRLPGKVSYCDHRGNKKAKFFIPSFTLSRLYCISKTVTKAWPPRYHSKIKVINNCIAVDKFDLKPRYDIDELKNYNVLFVGRITEEKGIHYLLEAVKILAGLLNGNNISTNIIGSFEISKGGSPSYYKTCFSYVTRNHLTKSIHFLGERTSEEIRYLMSKSDILVVPSIWEEAFGLVTIEAFASGLPVIAFNKGASPEIIKDGKSGFIVESISAEALANTIHKHYQLPNSLKKEMESFSREYANNFDCKTISQIYFEDIKMNLNVN